MVATPSLDHVPPLPIPLTSFVGREREVADVCAFLRRADLRLLTLTGPGGVGKTRLALAVAQRLADDMVDGVRVVLLGAINDPGLVVPTIARALRLGEIGHRSLCDRLADHLGSRRFLLILDNFEQLLPAAPAVVDLLERCPALTILVTSRVVLRVSGEQIFRVLPLALPDPGPGQQIEQFAAAEAIRLFVDRARAARPDFALTEATGGTVAAICCRLDGLPLAIELAAARIRHLPLAILLDRIERRLPLLTGGARDQPARLQTMRDAIAWSYDLLSPDEQAMFRRLAVFVGGSSLEAAEHVGGEPPAVLDDIAALVDASLLRQEPGPDGAARYSMLETIREYGLERLEDAGEEKHARDAHAVYFVAWDERLDPNRVEPGERVDDRLWRVEVDLPNFRAALAHLANGGDAEGVLWLAGALAIFWHHRGDLREGRRWLEWALAHTADAPTATRARALAGLSLILWSQGDYEPAGPLALAARSIAEQIGDTELAALSVHMIGLVEFVGGHLDRAGPLMEEALGLWRELGLRSDEAMALTVLGGIAYRLGDPATSANRGEEALALFRALGHPSGAATALGMLARLARDRGDDKRAVLAYQEGLSILVNVDARWSVIGALEGADSALIFPRWAGIEDRRSVVRALTDLAVIAVAHGQPDAAAMLVGAVGGPLRGGEAPILIGDLAHYERAVANATVALGEARFAGLYAAGRALSLKEAVAVASTVSIAAAPVGTAALTRREHEVLRLLAEGRTDREIADALFVSPRTVMSHVQHIFAKLGVHDRQAAAAMAAAHDLV